MRTTSLKEKLYCRNLNNWNCKYKNRIFPLFHVLKIVFVNFPLPARRTNHEASLHQFRFIVVFGTDQHDIVQLSIRHDVVGMEPTKFKTSKVWNAVNFAVSCIALIRFITLFLHPVALAAVHRSPIWYFVHYPYIIIIIMKWKYFPLVMRKLNFNFSPKLSRENYYFFTIKRVKSSVSEESLHSNRKKIHKHIFVNYYLYSSKLMLYECIRFDLSLMHWAQKEYEKKICEQKWNGKKDESKSETSPNKGISNRRYLWKFDWKLCFHFTFLFFHLFLRSALHFIDSENVPTGQ